MIDLTKFINNSDPIIAEAGDNLEAAMTDLEVGSISQSAYDKLCCDILDESMLESVIKDIDRLQDIFTAFREMNSVIKIIRSIEE